MPLSSNGLMILNFVKSKAREGNVRAFTTEGVGSTPTLDI